VTTDTKPVYHYLLVEKRWAEPLSFSGNMRRCLCTVNGTLKFHCSLMPSGRNKGAFFISINKANREKLGLEPGDGVDVELVRDDSKYGMPMPEEFREVLKQDADGKKHFHSLTPGKQRTLLWYTVKHKDEDRRIQTALVMIDHLKKNEGKIVWRELSDELKLRREPEW
jgi:bifunctional DNA-binding transcriptional regulator/antitoxin component of YhaV-PrlF toxin-antitoxin module